MTNKNWFESMRLLEKHLPENGWSIQPNHDEVYVALAPESLSAEQWEELERLGWIRNGMGGIMAFVSC